MSKIEYKHTDIDKLVKKEKISMSQYKAISIYVIGMLLLIVILISQIAPPVQAAPSLNTNKTESPISISKTPSNIHISTNIDNIDSSVAQVSTPESVSSKEEILQQIAAYKEKFDAYAMQSGWTLVKYDQYDILPTSGNRPLPAKHQRETWSHFDQNKQIFEEVEYATAPEIGTVLLGYFSKGTLISIWNDESFQQQSYTPSYDFYLSNKIKGLIDEGRDFEINSSPSEIKDNKKVTMVELKIAYSEQEQKWFNVNHDQPMWGTFERYYFDSSTGMLLRYEHNYLMSDMSIVPSAITDNFQIIADTQPSADILRLVEGE
jgi:hypothetical protein